jgi:hypothetical protein
MRYFFTKMGWATFWVIFSSGHPGSIAPAEKKSFMATKNVQGMV